MATYYRLGSSTPKNFTPRPEIDTQGPGAGLSVQNSQPASKYQSIESTDLKITQALHTPTKNNPNHYSICTNPNTQDLLDSWAGTRNNITDKDNNWENPLVSAWSHDVYGASNQAEEGFSSARGATIVMQEPSNDHIGGADVFQLLPKHKLDTEAAARLVNVSADVLKPHYFVLIEWLKDLNWPVAQILAPRLAQVGPPLKDAVLTVLKGNDTIWKYWVVSQLVNTNDLRLASVIKHELAVQAHQLSSSQDEDEAILVKEIKDVLNKITSAP